MKNLLIFSLMISVLTGCATGYGKAGITGGYREQQINDNTFEVKYYGNAYSDLEAIGDFALLRAAELTLGKGFKYFIVVSTNAYKKAVTERYGLYTTFDYLKPEAILKIECFRDRAELDSEEVYVAEELVISLKEKHKLK